MTDALFWFDGHTWDRPFHPHLGFAAVLGVTVDTWVVQATRDSDGQAFMTVAPAEVLDAYGIKEEA